MSGRGPDTSARAAPRHPGSPSPATALRGPGLSSPTPRVGLLLPTFDPLRVTRPRDVVATARAAEALGFDGVWVGDHLCSPAPVLDAPTVLAAAAVVTERVTLGLSVMLMGLRSPAWTAKQLATIDALSGGRLLLGVGVGGEFPEEFVAAGVAIRQRGRRLDELLTLLPDLLQGRPVSHHGRALQLEVPALQPAMPAMPPLFVGGRSEVALRRAARFGDAWLPMWMTPDAIRERSERLAELAQEHGRPRPSLALLIGVHVDDELQRSRVEASAYLRGQYGMPLERVERWSALGEVERVTEHLAEHLTVGVSEFVLMPLAAESLTQVQRLAEVRERLLAAAPVVAVAAGPKAGGGT